MNNILKYGIIAAAWIIYLIIGLAGGGSDSSTTTESTTAQPETTVVATTEETAETASIELIDGELGDYGKEIIMSEGTDLEEHLIVYYVPAGKYTVKNLGSNPTQVSVYEGFAKNNETGYDEYTNAGDIVVLAVDGEDEIEVPDGWFIEIHGAHISLTAK